MKKQVIKIVLGLLPVLGFSQMVVHDPVQEANMATQISNSSEQIIQMEKSLEYMKKSAETLEKVSSHIRNLKDLEKITGIYRESFALAQKVRSNIHKVKSPARQKMIMDDVADIISSLSEGIQFVGKILSNDFYKMTDKERMDLISTERRKVLMKRARLISYTL